MLMLEFKASEFIDTKSLKGPSYQGHTGYPTEHNRCVLCIDIVSSKYNEDCHERGPHSHCCFGSRNHGSHCQTHGRCSKRLSGDNSTEFPKSGQARMKTRHRI
uniref:Uncharacterized protein n=1 Tax=Opuntia streptacantha TaxID=393608 RepID=A0A7C9AT31_OPUST